MAERGEAIIEPSSESAERREISTEIFAERQLRILIAEDNPVNQKVISAMLGPVDCEFDFVQDGLQAVAAVTKSNYDLVLMDVQMPQMDGTEATKRIRSLPNKISQIPIIAMTANAMQGDRETYLEGGMNEYVSKPIDQRELVNAIVRQSNIEMPDMTTLLLHKKTGSAPEQKPITADAEGKMSDLIGDIEGLLDGTND